MKKSKLYLLIILCSINLVGCKKTIDYTENTNPSYTANLEDISISLESKTLEVIDNKNCLVVKANIKNLSNELIYPTDFFIVAEQDYNELLLVDEIEQDNNYNIAYKVSDPIKSNSDITLDYIFEIPNNTPINLYLWTLNSDEPLILEENFII